GSTARAESRAHPAQNERGPPPRPAQAPPRDPPRQQGAAPPPRPRRDAPIGEGVRERKRTRLNLCWNGSHDVHASKNTLAGLASNATIYPTKVRPHLSSLSPFELGLTGVYFKRVMRGLPGSCKFALSRTIATTPGARGRSHRSCARSRRSRLEPWRGRRARRARLL